MGGKHPTQNLWVKLPEYDGQSNSYQMEWRDLVVMVEGIRESHGQRLRWLRAQHKEYVV